MPNCSETKNNFEENDMLLIISVSINMILLIVNVSLLYDKLVNKATIILPSPPPPYASDV